MYYNTSSNISNVSAKQVSAGEIRQMPINYSAVPHTIPAHKETKSYLDFVSVGDWGCTPETDKTINNILKRDPNLVIGLGDYSYSDSEKCWMDKIKPIAGIVNIVFGNHENAGNYPLSVLESLTYSTPEVYLDKFGLKNQYYSFNYGNSHFLILSSEVPYEKGSTQFEFASNDLKAASQNTTIKWIIVANHRTMYAPYYGPSIALDTAIANKFRDIYHPLFDLYGVDLVLQGHVHYYQRTYPLKYNDKNPVEPVITDLHNNYYANPQGTMFLTIGTGGVGIGRPDNIGKPYYSAFSNTGIFGILYIKIKNNGSLLEATFYNNDNGSEQYRTSDSFRIIKNIS
jgi:3',5'-cyclic AMP phosphodiesterase CpdA